jgi:hypothetical protein
MGDGAADVVARIADADAIGDGAADSVAIGDGAADE